MADVHLLYLRVPSSLFSLELYVCLLSTKEDSSSSQQQTTK
jgi:hypothetical protein